ncbi:YheC/D like ATP-grasp [[Bacillus] enclensis]|uniref:YheC/D like ATP-grasp n=2 Tax=[Bacillus] enclensis TaxID=1402860 RepID=A0A1C4AXJ3_9BACI|nr:YheC/D like ATP-grasp [[Bacillus] enclensis]
MMMFKSPFFSLENHREENELILPHAIYNKFDFAGKWKLKAGAASLHIECFPSGSSAPGVTLRSSDPLFSSLPRMEHALVDVDRDRKLISIGPITALLIDNLQEEKLYKHSLKEYFTECQRWFQQQGGLFFLMTVSSFVKDEGEGYLFEQGEWQKRIFPFPDVIYNRSHSRKIESQKQFLTALTRTGDRSIHLFNSTFLSKDSAYAHLKTHSEVLPHLPETATGLEQLEEMLSIYNDVFVKAVNGSKGRYIIRIQKREKDYLVSQNSFSSKPTHIFPTYSSLYRQLQSWCRHSQYIVQETIPFLTFNGQTMDFRFLCHKNHRGSWSVISAAARIGSENQFVANIDQGGRMESPIKILSVLFPVDHSEIYSNMKEVSLSCSSYLSEHLEGNFAEFGVDIGVDSAGKPWIIEVNSKPSKKTFIDNERIRPSVIALYEYSYNIWKGKGGIS